MGVGKDSSGVSCRFHDLRHTGCRRMLEAGVPFSVAATIMGWSPSTTIRMSRRYGHIGQTAQRNAVNALIQAGIQDDGAQNWAQSQMLRLPQLTNRLKRMAPRARFELGILGLIAEEIKNLNVASSVAYIRFEAILSVLPASNPAPKLCSETCLSTVPHHQRQMSDTLFVPTSGQGC
jgi:hypothetical protein